MPPRSRPRNRSDRDRHLKKARKGWTDSGGELISLPPDEQADMMKTFSSVGADVSETKPLLNEAYQDRDRGGATNAIGSFFAPSGRRGGVAVASPL